LVDLINNKLFAETITPWVAQLVEYIPVPFFREMITDADFGVLPTGLFLALGLVLPVLFCFYSFFGILEDSGYLPRLSFLLDGLFHKIGLNGKGVMSLIMGFSCITMAVLTTRMLDSKKEKNIATLLLLLGLPCAPILGVMFVILGGLPFSATATVIGILSLQILSAGYFANKIFTGKRSPLLLEITPMRIPHFGIVLKRAAFRTYVFMKEAVPVFVTAAVILFLIQRAGGLDLLEKTLRPITVQLMGLPEKSVQVFIKTMIRKESGATELKHLSAVGGVYTNLQLVVNILVLTFFMPCLNTFIVLVKERGIKTALFLVTLVLCWAIVLATVVNHLCLLMGITFATGGILP
ncbi:MAG: ferrous iron transporter B, partial [Oligoflexia bacterium]|nr:ferrous iron transporter B [Oligoflexia bacterium]